MTHSAIPSTTRNDTKREPTGRKWPFIIVGLLLLNVTVCAVTVTLSLRNPAQVTPGYYDKALNWDAERAASTTPPPATEAEND